MLELGAQSEKFLNIKDVSEYLRISQEEVEELVEKGEIPAYRIGGTYLRFRKDQIEAIKSKFLDKTKKIRENIPLQNSYTRFEKVKDFLYFNDFYIISAIIIVIILIVTFRF